MTWHSFQEKRPKDQETFLGWDGCEVNLYKLVHVSKNKFYLESLTDQLWMDDLTHWMPLPEGPDG